MRVAVSPNITPNKLPGSRPLAKSPSPSPQPDSGLLAPAASAAGDRLLDLSYATSALPKFIYPTVVGTPAQEAMTWEVLNSLPMHHAVRPVSIEAQASFSQGPNYLGLNRVAIGRITVNSSGYDMELPSQFKETVTHEVGHSVDYKGGIFSMVTRQNGSAHDAFGKPGFVSDYAETNPAEDFAESYKVHHTQRGLLDAVNQDKAEVLHEADRASWLERYVDKPAFRETGKFIGRQFRSVPILRSGLELVRQVTVANLAIVGGTETIQGVVQGDWGRAANGLLSAGAGAGLAMAPHTPWLGVAATAALGGKRGLDMAQKEGVGPAQQTAAALAGAVGGTVGGFVGPLALVQAGYVVAGGLGGTIGMVVGGLMGGFVGSTLAAKASLALTA
jgi:hypothetical protein